ncbi:hypothetical protein ES703_08236 [subsurface metagenome]
MKCPKCGKEINKVGIITQNWQEGTLKGNKVVGHGPPEYIDDSTIIECPECFQNITDSIEE